ncbi:MAG: hypothetical protein NPIRA02_19070 [Nitrospirales bacterium]|nr:MAG: hypothetical protein NPIRA02_19070 [Nitrospirales bacterium]
MTAKIKSFRDLEVWNYSEIKTNSSRAIFTDTARLPAADIRGVWGRL